MKGFCMSLRMNADSLLSICAELILDIYSRCIYIILYLHTVPVVRFGLLLMLQSALHLEYRSLTIPTMTNDLGSYLPGPLCIQKSCRVSVTWIKIIIFITNAKMNEGIIRLLQEYNVFRVWMLGIVLRYF